MTSSWKNGSSNPLGFAVLAMAMGFSIASAQSSEFIPAQPESEFLPAVAGEPSIDFCANWNPEFGYRGYRCCSNGAVSRNVSTVSTRRRRSRRASACAPDRIKWSFCDEMTPEQRDYIAGVKTGRIDALETIQKNMGSRGGQAFCGAGNGFLVEGRPLIPTSSNRVELRNEPRCANFGTDPLVGALEWTGREIKKEFSEPEFDHARMIVGDISAPRGGCVSGRGGRRAHKSHTTGIDVDLAFFNPRSGHLPEERFTRNFYVASNWWFLKKVFKNPFSCVKVIFLDRSHISLLQRYAKDDPEWSKYRPFLRHVRGHKDHFHIRFGSGPGVAGCMSDPNLEEDEDQMEVSEDGLLVKSDSDEGDKDGEKEVVEGEDLDFAADPVKTLARESARAQRKAALNAPGAVVENDPSSIAAASVSSIQSGLASGPQLEATTLPAHKLEPMITARYKVKKRSGRRGNRTRIGRK